MEEDKRPSWGDEALKQAWIIFPMLGFNLLTYLVQIISVIYVGHIGTLELSSASIATSVCNVSGFSFLLGLSYALDTLCGQAYGAKQYRMLGLFVQRAMLVLCIIAIPVSVLWFNMERLLLLFRLTPEISAGSGKYAAWLVPGLFAYAFLQPLVKLFQTTSKVLPLLWVSLVGLVTHILTCWFLVHKFGMGFIGAALALSITNWLLVICLAFALVVTPECRQCWSGVSREVFQGILGFLKLAIAAAIMICLEWWAFEVIVLLGGSLPKPELQTSVLSIVFSIVYLADMPTNGLIAAASVRISNELGAGRSSRAQFSFYVSVTMSICYALLATVVLLATRTLLGRIFSNDVEVCNYITNMVPWVIGLVVVASMQRVGYGVACGCGWQKLVALVNVGAYYIIGLPVACILGFSFHLQGQGLLSGLLSGCLMQAVGVMFVAFTLNWKEKASEVKERIGHSIASPLLADATCVFAAIESNLRITS